MNIQELIAEALEYLHGMWRYRWAALAAAWVVSIAGWYAVYTMPNEYAASSKVYLETDSLLDPIFKGLTIQDNLQAEVDAASRALLTRPHLETVARETDLALRAQTPKQFEGLITRLQSAIKVKGNRDRNVFDVSYTDTDRDKARDVVASIVNTFVEGSLQGQGNDTEVTEQALDAEIADHETRLQVSEDRLAQFKKDNLGYMPGDRGDYYTRLQASLAAVSTTENELRLLTEKRDELQRQIAGESPILASGGGPVVLPCTQADQLISLRAELAALQLQFTDKHPRILSLRDTVAQLDTLCKAEIAETSGVVVNADGSSEPNPLYQNLKLLLSNAEVDLASLRAQLRQQQSVVSELRVNVDKIADVETSLKRLNRDYTVVQERYQELLRRRETLRSRQRLDPVTDNLTFRILEPPFASRVPVGPNRPIFLMGTFVVALGIGGALAFGLNLLTPVFFGRRAVQKFSGVPVLGSVSYLRSPSEARRDRFRSIVWVTGTATIIAATVVVIAVEGKASALLRETLGRLST
ncbi:MAG: XrtA system polysaccharide chain length determinant [Pseudomonadota bacterium]